jgi:hypothetical protein
VERRGDDNIGVDHILTEGGTWALLVGGDDELDALFLEPIGDAELVLGLGFPSRRSSDVP